MREPLLLLDLETQKDLFQAGGSLYKQTANPIKSNIYRLFNWANHTGTPVISTQLLVRPGRRGPFGPVPHCAEGTEGAEKLTRTLLRNRINLGLAHNADLPQTLFEDYQQVIFETREPDLLRHAKAERLITELPTETRFIVTGAGVAQGIKQAVIGLRSRGFEMIVAEDAVLDLGDPAAEMAWLQMLAKSAQPMSTAQILQDYAPARRSRQARRSAVSR